MSNYSWDLNEGGSSGGDKIEFAKFPEGITRIRVIDQAPYQRWIHFLRTHKRSINCPGKGCPICEIRRQEKANKQPFTHNVQKKFALNIINRETGRIEIMEQGKTFIQDLIDLRTDLLDKGNDLLGADIKVRRRGMGKDDTTYRLDIDNVYPLSDIDKQLINKKVNFEEYFKPATPDQILRILHGEAWEDVFKSEEGNENVEIHEPSIGTDESIELE